VDWEMFLALERTNEKTVKIKLMYVDIAGDLISGLLLSQIIYWHLPGKSGVSKLRVKKLGREWLAKRRTDWHGECRITVKQYARAIRILENKQILITKVFKFNGEPTVHISLNKTILLGYIENYLNKKKEEEEENV
jgi:hypothetical protein